MKELSIEEKARAYDEALERVRKLYNSEETSADVEIACETIFPELAESEDEKIREKLIEFFKDWGKRLSHCWGLSIPDILAWLEKQGEHKDYYTKQELVDMGFSFTLNGDIVTLDKMMEDMKKYLAWLEKQSEKSQGKSALEAAKEEKVDNQNCVKPTDRVEPKFNFKVGQWIVATGKCVYIIAKIDGFNVTLVDTNGDEYVFDASSLDDAHEWSIQDAKDGDVLVNGSNIFIFSYLSDTRAMGYCHINLDDGRFYDDKDKTECFGLIDAVFSPATKEQRDTLFTKMRDAGYEWNDEKKELKKIEQKLSNSAKTCKNDTLLDLLQKIPSYITLDGIDYHFVMKKTSIYLAYYACYNGNGEEGRGNAIFGITAHSPIDLLTEMLEILKEKGLLE